MPFTIRGEQPQDYPRIALVHTRAFRHHSGESILVAIHRLRPEFDPELSIVAECNGEVVGHALFSPRWLSIGGIPVPAVNVAPVGVLPEWQRSGVGGALMQYGHELARSKGYQVSFLLGHVSYYPRFGYLTGAYGHSHLRVKLADLLVTAEDGEYTERPVQTEDIPALQALRAYCEAGVDFSVQPGDRLTDWVSAGPAMRSRVFLWEGVPAGYARYEPGKWDRVSCFLAADQIAARAMLRRIAGAPDRRGTGGDDLIVPLHPAAPATAELFTGLSWEGVTEARPSAMALELLPGSFTAYRARLERDEIPPGRVTWPVEFEMLD